MSNLGSIGTFRRRLRQIYLRRFARMQGSQAEPNFARPAVVFAPHPDDETLACGGTLARKAQAGARLHLVFMTDGRFSHRHPVSPEALAAQREEEALAAAGVLGIPLEQVTFLRFTDGRLAENLAAAVQVVMGILQAHRPAEVYIPHALEPPADHRATRQAVCEALEGMQPGEAVQVFEYPVWAWYHWPWVRLVQRPRRDTRQVLMNTLATRAGMQILREVNWVVDVTGVLERKRAALEQYRTQTVRLGPNGGYWPILQDVAKGEFLDSFFQPYEVFRQYAFGGQGTARINFSDRFTEERPAGKTVGSASLEGIRRGGADVEQVIGIDHGAARIQPLVQPGWGRAGIAYGPYRRESGLAFGVYLLNGHQAAQAGHLTQSLPRKLVQAFKGSRTRSLPKRLEDWLLRGSKKAFARQLRRWIWLDRAYRKGHGPRLDENLAAGWFSTEAPRDPAGQGAGVGNGFVVHSSGMENGELWARVGERCAAVLGGLQNIPVYLVVILREQGAAYYAASLAGARGLPAYPHMTPLAVDAADRSQDLYAGVYQSVMGQIGFRVDTRLYEAHVARLGQYAAWYGTAQWADRGAGRGPLSGSPAEVGGEWQVLAGEFERTEKGIAPAQAGSLAVLESVTASGLVHLVLETGESFQQADLLWRYHDRENHWRLTLAEKGCRLSLVSGGTPALVVEDEHAGLQSGFGHTVQILDDGVAFGLYLDGRLLFDRRFERGELGDAAGFAIESGAAPGGFWVRDIEAHPSQIPLPAAFNFSPPWAPESGPVVIADGFDGPAGDLSGRRPSAGEGPWRRELGPGKIEIGPDSSGAQVRASAGQPNPGRTAYTLPWPDPGYADLAVEIWPPPDAPGEQGRAGLIFWQDSGNHILVNNWLNAGAEGASISSFYTINGHEEIFDAVWTNVGNRIRLGQPYTLRIRFDGVTFLASIDGEPVLYRAISDVYPACDGLAIRRVGIVANWEWGNDTGSIFRQLVARGPKHRKSSGGDSGSRQRNWI